MRATSFHPVKLNLIKLLFTVLASIVVPAVGIAANKLPGLERLQELDQYAFNTPDRYATDVPTLASYLSKATKNDYEKARVIFAWISGNIRYDDYSYNTGKPSNATPESVLKYRRAVCDGYARLYKALGEEMGLKVEKVSGYAKGFGYASGRQFQRTNHAWNSVYVGNRWILVDATWASGSATAANGQLRTVKKYDPSWFDVEPHVFLFTHMPVVPEFQQIPKPITLVQYERLAFVDPSLFKLGIEAKAVLAGLLEGKLKSVATTWDTDLDIKIVNAPLEAKLQPGKSYTLAFAVADDVEMVVKNGKDWHRFTESNNNTQTLKIRPVNGKVAVMARKRGSRANYFYFLEYQVGR